MTSSSLLQLRQATYLIGLSYALLLVGLFHTSYAWLIGVDWNKEDYTYGYLIPIIVLYLIWEKKDELASHNSSPSWTAMLVILPGLILYWLGELGGEFYSLYLSSWLLLVGLCWLHMGWKKLKFILFPLCFILSMFPPPSFIHAKISFQLKLISSKLGVAMLQLYGMSVYREGNIIDLGFTKLQVVDACNGLRYLIPLIVLGVLLAYFYRGPLWHKLIIVASTIPLSIITNGFRIASVGVLYQYFGAAAAEGFFHDFSGWFIFMVTLVILLAEIWLLKKLFPIKKKNQHQSPPPVEKKSRVLRPSSPTTISGIVRSPHFLVPLLLLGTTLAMSTTVEFREKTPTNMPLSQFPTQMGPWQGQPEIMEQKFIDALNFSDYTIINYKNTQQQNVNFYVAYYESQRKGKSIHSPATCLPGGGWIFHEAGTVTIMVNGKPMPVNRALIQKDETKQLSYYWFPQRDRILTNAYQLKIYNFWDALTRQRTDGALVRLITPVYSSEQEADKRLQAFVAELTPQLNTFLPE